jgi:hypothetical protein
MGWMEVSEEEAESEEKWSVTAAAGDEKRS